MNQYSISRGRKWAPKGLFVFSAFSFIVLFIFNQSVYKIPLLDWALSSIVVVVIVLFIFFRCKVVKDELVFVILPVLWVGYALAVTPFATNVNHHLIQLFVAFFLSVIGIALIISVFSSEHRHLVFNALSIVWIAISFLFVLAWFGGEVSYELNAFSGPFDNRNAYAIQTGIIVSLLVFFTKNGVKKNIIMLLGFMLVLTSLSVKGLLTYIFIILFPKYLDSSFSRKSLWVLCGIFLVMFAYFLIPGLTNRIDRFLLVITSPEELRISESAFLRVWFYLESIPIILENPIFGIGVDNSRFFLIPPHFEQMGGEGTYAHSNHLEILLSVGLPGYILHYGPLIYILIKVKTSHEYYKAITTYILLYIFLGFVMVTYSVFATVFLYALPLFLYYFHSIKRAKNTNENFIHR